MQVALELNSLTKKFGNLVAVDNLSLKIFEGEMIALVGPDAAGKTTTLRMICGLLGKTGGTIKIFGKEISIGDKEIKKSLGYLSQKFSLYGDLTIDENIEFFAEIHGVQNFITRREELLDFTRLKKHRDKLGDNLSGGMKQKLALACTLIHTPKIILLDEPTAGVDPVSRRDFWKILSELLKTNVTILLTTQYLDEAERCARVGLINEGKLLQFDKPSNLEKSLTDQFIEVVCSPIRKAFKILLEETKIQNVQAFGDRIHFSLSGSNMIIPQVIEKLKNSSINVDSWRNINPTLENVFISLVTDEEKKIN
ncbi:MAG: ABC transporter ATP-binding protein [Bacteroidetes bacterium]|nr:ABC transporter ATP-binding protein [Bacteroidota bacterium]